MSIFSPPILFIVLWIAVLSGLVGVAWLRSTPRRGFRNGFIVGSLLSLFLASNEALLVFLLEGVLQLQKLASFKPIWPIVIVAVGIILLVDKFVRRPPSE